MENGRLARAANLLPNQDHQPMCPRKRAHGVLASLRQVGAGALGPHLRRWAPPETTGTEPPPRRPPPLSLSRTRALSLSAEETTCEDGHCPRRQAPTARAGEQLLCHVVLLARESVDVCEWMCVCVCMSVCVSECVRESGREAVEQLLCHVVLIARERVCV